MSILNNLQWDSPGAKMLLISLFLTIRKSESYIFSGIFIRI